VKLLEEKQIDSSLLYKGIIVDVKVDQVMLPNGKQTAREVVLHPGAVAILALNNAKEITLIKQFRYPVSSIIWELPAGKLEVGEDPLECAKRELAEETGLGARKWKKLSRFFTGPGFTNEVIHLFLAEDLCKEIKIADDDEFIEVHSIPFETAEKMIFSGEINDAKTIAGILMLSRTK
jgi:ADP-ribose pyrophosphatase